MAEREGLAKANPSNVLDFLTLKNRAFETKGKSPGLSNPSEPPPDRQEKTAVPAGPRSGGDNQIVKDDDISPTTIERLEAIAAEIEPPFGAAETAVLWAIALADELMPDPEAEPSLGWTLGRTAAGPHPIFENWTDREQYQRWHCADLEGGGYKL